ncbi:hypothetical protein VKT23_003555 [Stygiomarasmius scandens]|uniref:WD40 repeat-like protein n=1 Tax=Marasmiellus scandens TaxID=2682957 RepID=A0ABR1JXL1_9AGAR
MNSDLPGFYWHPKRNRYFPHPPLPDIPDNITIPPRRHRHPALLLNALSSATSRAEQLGLFHEIHTFSISATSVMNHTRPLPTLGKITAFCSANGTLRRLIGDDTGSLYAHHPGSIEWPMQLSLYPDSQVSSISISGQKCVATCFGPVARIAVQNIDLDADPNSGFDYGYHEPVLLRLNDVHDVWTGYLSGNALTLGAHKQAIHIPDIESSNSPLQVLHTGGSDVFSVSQHPDDASFDSNPNPNLVYTGCRNGSIFRFDLRVGGGGSGGGGRPERKKLFELNSTATTATATRESFVDFDGWRGNGRGRGRGRGKGRGRGNSRHSGSNFNSTSTSTSSPVVHLQVLKDSQVLVARMNGELSTYDLRFPDRSNPTKTFKGHVNSVTQRLGICVDPFENYIFAAGEDGKIRGWSMRTGELLSPPSAPMSQASNRRSEDDMDTDSPGLSHISLYRQNKNPFTSVFPAGTKISAMQITQEMDGLSLWAAAGRDLYEYKLGQVSVL